MGRPYYYLSPAHFTPDRTSTIRLLLLLFIALPILELLLLFQVADVIGGLSTVLLVILTALVGLQVLRRQGLATFTRANARLQAGQLPAMEVLEGLCIAAGGALLLTPGFITDTMGFLLLVPPTRRRLVEALLKSGRVAFFTGGVRQPGPWEHARRPGERDVVEGEFRRETPEDSRLGDRGRK